MKLIDTNILVFAWDENHPLYKRALELLASAIADEGAGVSAITLAELSSFAGRSNVAAELLAMRVSLLDIPAAAGERCGQAYQTYLAARKLQSGKAAPRTPLPDFFIGAHAEVCGMELVTNDPARFRTYFPGVKLVLP